MSASSMEHDLPEVPDHEILSRVGRGSYGEVWLARNVAGSFRAVKIARQSAFDSERPYTREFEGLKKFEPVSRGHPGLVSILHIGRDEKQGLFYCVMEPADDVATGQEIRPDSYRPRTLASEIARRARIPAGEAAEIGEALARGLARLHSHGLVHRDVKPSNIIFVNGVPKLADIGLVTVIGANATRVGTEGYIPPEGPGLPTADIYALGRVLYETASGRKQEDFPELPTDLPSMANRGEFMGLNAIVLQACSREPSERYRSAEEMAEALRDLRDKIARAGLGSGRAGTSLPAEIRTVAIVASRQQARDGFVARSIARRLAGEGLRVFVDEEEEITVERGRRLEREILGADLFLPILSRSAVTEPLMVYALEVAARARSPARTPRVFAVTIESLANPPRNAQLALEEAEIIPLHEVDEGSDPGATTILELARRLGSGASP